MTAPRISKDPAIYGIEFRCVEGVIQWRHTPPAAVAKGAWQPLTTISRGRLVCDLGWTPGRLRIWAGLLERPERRRAIVGRRGRSS